MADNGSIFNTYAPSMSADPTSANYGASLLQTQQSQVVPSNNSGPTNWLAGAGNSIPSASYNAIAANPMSSMLSNAVGIRNAQTLGASAFGGLLGSGTAPGSYNTANSGQDIYNSATGVDVGGDGYNLATAGTGTAGQAASTGMSGGQIAGGVAGGVASLYGAYEGASTDTTGSVVSGAISGAEAGAAFGPWGMAVGAVVGGIAGFFGSKSKKKAAKKAYQQQLELDIAPQKQQEANYLQNQGLLQKAMSNYSSGYTPGGYKYSNSLLKGANNAQNQAFGQPTTPASLPNFNTGPSDVATGNYVDTSKGVPAAQASNLGQSTTNQGLLNPNGTLAPINAAYSPTVATPTWSKDDATNKANEQAYASTYANSLNQYNQNLQNAAYGQYQQYYQQGA